MISASHLTIQVNKIVRTVILGLAVITALASGAVAQTGLIHVTVEDANGMFLFDATVSIARIDGDADVRERNPVTKDEGTFIFSGLREGTYRLAVNHQYFGPATERTISIKAGDEIKLKIALGQA